jgi:imidazolonepropionase-like amidohydrolase
MRRSFRQLPAILALVVLCATARADQVLVIEGARIVPGNGPVIEKGTIVVEGDKITKVGAQVQKPADAQVIDGKGLTVYPGLIDAACLAGVSAPPSPPRPAQPQPAAQQGQQGQRRGGRQGGAGAGFTPPPAAPLVWRKATEGFNAKSSALPALRNNGYTTALLCPRGVLTPGEAVLINLLPGDTPSVIEDRAAVNVNTLSRGGGTYPTTLMGAFAFLRQSFYDGIDYENRPHDKTDVRLNALGTAAQGKIPVFCTANSENDIKRAIRLRDEFKFKLCVLGGREADKAAGALAERKIPVVLTDDWNQALALKKAGVPFVLASNQIEMTAGEADGLRSKALTLIEKGLSPDAVLAALTQTPADLLGVADRLGSVAPGKLANLVITEGDLFSKEGKVKFVVVKGQKLEPVQVKADKGPRPQRVAADGVPFRNVAEDDADGHHDGDGGER